MKIETPYRKMANAEFRASQHAGVRLPHIAPINDLVDELRAEPGRGWAPYLAPLYGGVDARLLSVLQDPGPKTDDVDGSGMICVENEDATAQYMSELLADAGIPTSEIVAWNAYPWLVHRRGELTKLTAADKEAGVEPLRRIVAMLPNLRVVMLHGGVAWNVWDRLAKRHPRVTFRYEPIKTFHTARTAFRSKHPEVREYRRQHLRDAFALAAQQLRSAEAS